MPGSPISANWPGRSANSRRGPDQAVSPPCGKMAGLRRGPLISQDYLAPHACDAWLVCHLPDCWAEARTLYRAQHSGPSPPPLWPAAFPPCGNSFLQLMWLRSPLERGHIFFQPARICMADMSDNALSTELIEFILRPSLRRAPNPPPSDPVSRHRTEIVSSSRDQGSLAERISSSLALCPTLDLASASHQALSSDRAFFCPAGTRDPQLTS